jgi:hypothetical protein
MLVLRKNKQIMPFGNEQTQENEEKAQKKPPDANRVALTI